MNDTELIGRKFGRLVVVEFAEIRIVCQKNRRFFKCRCDCGNESIVEAGNLKSGNSKSCGCRKFNGYDGNATHGLSGTFEYRVWKGMRKRCNAPNSAVYKYYGGRGIRVCERWNDFEAFLRDMGKAPSEKHSIERKDVNGNYTPDNCEWIVKREQSKNRRDTIRITYKGVTKTLLEWAEHFQIPFSTLRGRYFRKWDTERLLTTPSSSVAPKCDV